MEATTVERSIWINAPRERVWKAITDDKQLQQWWADYWSIPVLQVGATIKFGTEDDPLMATIAVFDPPREFGIHWTPQPQYHSVEMTTTFTLEEENGGTRLTVKDTGFEGMPDDIRREQVKRTNEGYTKVLAALKAMLEAE